MKLSALRRALLLAPLALAGCASTGGGPRNDQLTSALDWRGPTPVAAFSQCRAAVRGETDSIAETTRMGADHAGVVIRGNNTTGYRVERNAGANVGAAMSALILQGMSKHGTVSACMHSLGYEYVPYTGGAFPPGYADEYEAVTGIRPKDPTEVME